MYKKWLVMCSICGFLSYRKKPTRIVTDMLQKTEHRGPDAHGLYADGEIWRSRELSDLESSEMARVCLGHSELSIVKGGEDVIQPFRLVMVLYRWYTMVRYTTVKN